MLTVDDDREVSAAITRDLRSRYGADYRIVQARSGAEALALLTKLARRNQPVALIAADQRMPEMTGIEMLEQARTQTPGAKYLLLTAYADTDAAIKAINDIGLDYYLLKPWDPPDERHYPVVDDLLGDWQHAHPDHTSGLRVVRASLVDRSHEVKLRLSTRTDRDFVVVEFGDTGSGMSPAVADRAFEVFYTTKDVGEGTGLGLDIARRIIVDRHGGTIRIDSRPGETVLQVRLPVRVRASR